MLLSSSTSLEAGTSPRLYLECEGGQQETLCSALLAALDVRFPEHSLTTQVDDDERADLAVRYVAKHQAKDWLSGQLIWLSADGRTGDGPIIEYSVMDRQLNSDDMTPFALQLVRATEFPQ